jgi:hypothetical protein
MDTTDGSIQKTWNLACEEECMNLAKLLIKKQNDYGKNNILEFGYLGLLVRMNDKISRLKNLEKLGAEKKQVGEAVIDTIQDIAGYAILMRLYLDGKFDLPFDGMQTGK